MKELYQPGQSSANSETDTSSFLISPIGSKMQELIAGGLAGGLGKTLVAPLERVKILFQTGSLKGRGVYCALTHIYRSDGPLGLYRGNGASVLRIVPYAAIHFAAFERYRAALQLAQGIDPEDPDQQPLPVADLVAGAAAGATAVLFTYPLDLVRTRLAYSSSQPAPGGSTVPRGVHSATSSVPANQGTPQPLGSGGSSSGGSSGKSAGSGSRIPDVSQRLQQSGGVRQAGGAHTQQQLQQARIRAMVAGILRQEGARGLYRGIGPTMVGVLPYAGLKFYVYQSCKQHWRAAAGVEASRPVPIGLMLSFGAIAGLVAQTATYPLDVVRRRMQVQAFNEVEGTVHLRSTWHGLRAVAASGGRGALFAGLSINYLKVVPATAIGFTLYDSLKQVLGLKASV